VAAAAKKTELSKAMLTELTSGMRQGEPREVYEQMSPGAVFFIKDRLSVIKKVQRKIRSSNSALE